MVEAVKYAAAIDIGTTNIEAALVKVASDSADIMSTISRPNAGRSFGRDVMTRITQAERGNLHRMSSELRAQLTELIEELIVSLRAHKSGENSGTENEVDISRIVIACNTTMTHILLEEDCHNLGVYPFRPVHIRRTDIMSTDIGILNEHRPILLTILPGFSAYVGGDILSGVLSLDILNKIGRTLLIDLGTNGEMVYNDSENGRILVTSAAAGPAFELAGRAKATEIIEGIAHLRRKGLLDETGLLTDEYFDTGYRYKEVDITQKLVRDVQTAKAAIMAGIEILLSKDAVPDNVYISGAFGENLDMEAAIAIGMFPEAFRGRVTLCGNTSLSGAVLSCAKDIDCEIPHFEELYLANEPDFNELYISYMNLP